MMQSTANYSVRNTISEFVSNQRPVTAILIRAKDFHSQSDTHLEKTLKVISNCNPLTVNMI